MEQILEFLTPLMFEQLVDVPKIVAELAVSSGGAGSFGPEANGTTSAAATAVAKPVVEVRPPGIAKHSATTESVFAVFPGEAGSSWSRACGTTSKAEMAAVAKSVVEPQPLGIAKCSAMTESELAESSGGSSWPGADDTPVAAASAAAMSAGEARPLESQSRVSRQNPNSQSLLVSFPMSQSLWVKRGVVGYDKIRTHRVFW